MDSHLNEIEQLRQQMHEVRTSMGEEVHDLVENARSATDWRLYWRNHPWAWCGAAAALGYLIVPTRRLGRADVQSLVKLSQSATKQAPPSAGRRIMVELAGMAIGFVAQRGMQLLGDRLETFLASHSAWRGGSFRLRRKQRSQQKGPQREWVPRERSAGAMIHNRIENVLPEDSATVPKSRETSSHASLKEFPSLVKQWGLCCCPVMCLTAALALGVAVACLIKRK